jgi:hypothetical protein
MNAELVHALRELLGDCDCWAASDSRERARKFLEDITVYFLWKDIDSAPKDGTWTIVFDHPMTITAYWDSLQHKEPCWRMVGSDEKIYPTHWLDIPLSPHDEVMDWDKEQITRGALWKRIKA